MTVAGEEGGREGGRKGGGREGEREGGREGGREEGRKEGRGRREGELMRRVEGGERLAHFCTSCMMGLVFMKNWSCSDLFWRDTAWRLMMLAIWGGGRREEGEGEEVEVEEMGVRGREGGREGGREEGKGEEEVEVEVEEFGERE